tara:strand:- start:532 stop:723 length:192 start_codon:yes stop_codon:yes gene_type:complete
MIYRGALMSCGNKFKHKAKETFDKVVEWDKKLIKKCQDKFGLTDYQVVCISFAKGFIIGAILL